MTGVLDAAALLIICISALSCFLRGFVKTIFGVLGSIVAIILAVVISFFICDAVYNTFVKSYVTQFAYDLVSEIDAGEIIENYLTDNGVTGDIDKEEINEVITGEGDLSENISAYAKSKGEYDVDVKALMDEYLSDDKIDKALDFEGAEELGVDKQQIKTLISDGGGEIEKTLKAAADPDKHKAAEALEADVLSGPAKSLTRSALIIALFLVLRIIIAIVIHALGLVNKFEPAKTTDRLLGLACGLISGTVSVMCIAYALYVINAVAGSRSPIPVDMVEKTTVFKYFYNFFDYI